MDATLSYLWESAICLTLFYIPFVLFFRNKTFFALNRFYMLFSIILSLVIPLISITLESQKALSAFSFLLEPVTITPEGTQDNGKQFLSSPTAVILLYISGTLLFFLLFVQKLIHTFLLIGRHKVKEIGKVKQVCMESEFAPASFFNYVFVSADDELDEIMEHEKAHIALGHSWDIVFMELALALLWFNPVIWLMRRDMRNIHEFQADDHILKKGFKRCTYQHLVFERSFGLRIQGVAAHFNVSPLKQRLKMMTKDKSKNTAKWQYLFGIAIMALAFMYLSLEEVTGQSDVVDTENPIPIQNDTPQQTNVEEEMGEIFSLVEEMPNFQEKGQEGFRRYIVENLKYPEECIKNKIYGRVYVQFVVDKNGDVKNAKVIRSVDPRLDAEALRVVKSSPKWAPGKQRGQQVSVQFTFPVNFSLK